MQTNQIQEIKQIRYALPVERQVFIGAGSFVVISVLLFLLVDEVFIWFTLFVGLMLISAGLTGFCPMQKALEKMSCNVKQNEEKK